MRKALCNGLQCFGAPGGLRIGVLDDAEAVETRAVEDVELVSPCDA